MAASVALSDPCVAAVSVMPSSILYGEEYILNSRGLKLFTCRWIPATQQIKALVFLCHGYGVECSLFMKGTGVRLAQAGYAVFGMDYEGHGRSEGMRCYISDFGHVVVDCVAFFRTVREKEEYRNKARFLLGESMGGAVALRIHREEPSDWNGALLVAPMCKISEKVRPSPLVTFVLTKLCRVIPTWKIVPGGDIIDTGFKDPLKRQELRSNPYSYQDKPRLKTAQELLKATMDLESRLNEVTLPFLVLHGEADLVTDMEVSRELKEKAASFDKTLITYPGMWHSLTYGETEANADLVFTDMIHWLNERSPQTTSSCASPDVHLASIEHGKTMLPMEAAASASAGVDVETIGPTLP